MSTWMGTGGIGLDRLPGIGRQIHDLEARRDLHCPAPDRPVNDKDFDVALNLVFRNKAAHDTYQSHARHQKFIEKCQANWDKVRVFDSYLAETK